MAIEIKGVGILALGLACLAAGGALAWTRPGHMVTAAIAYDDLAARDPDVATRMAALLAHHPDRGAFEVAAGRATGEDRARRLFDECARWPDDARGTPFDHPTWHYAFTPVTRAGDSPPAPPDQAAVGDAVEAFALNAHVLRDPQATDAERALALCWVMHIAGDIHQPLHTGQLFSPAFPDGDHGGGLEFVKDPLTGEPITLHWFWDDSVNRSGDPADVAARARALEARFPRAGLAELKSPARIADFPAWAAESHAFAVSVAYATRLDAGAAAAAATALPPAYIDQATRLAERRVATAGYRLADVLREAFGRR